MDAPEAPILRSPRVTLRPFRDDDASARAELGRDDDIVRSFGGSPDWVGIREMTLDDGQEWLDRVRADRSPHSWAVEFEARFVGTARLHGLSEEDRRASYAVGLFDRSLLGRGLGVEVTDLVLGHAFRDVGLHRVGLRVLAYNTRAIACYRTCGFTEEGRERQAAWVDNAWHDEVMMGVLEHEHGAAGRG